MLATIFAMGGLLASLSLNDVPLAQAVDAIAKPELVYNPVNKNFYVVGENKSLGGILVQNLTNPSLCGRLVIGAAGEKARLTFDNKGNVYVIWQDDFGNGLQLAFARYSADCSNGTGRVNLGTALAGKFNSSTAGGNPDIAYSASEDRIYISTENLGNNLWVFSAPASGSGNWGDASNWDYGRFLIGGNNTQLNTKIAIDRNANAHVLFSRGGGVSSLRVIDLSGGVGGTWNTYGDQGLDISQDGGSWNVGGQQISIAPDGTTYATWVSPSGGGPASAGIARFTPGSGWAKIGDNVVGTSGYSSTKSVSVAASGNNTDVYIGHGTNNSYGIIYGSNNRGRNFGSGVATNGYGGEASEVTIAQGNNLLCLFAKDSTRNANFQCFYAAGDTGPVALPQFKSVGTVVDATGFYAPDKSTDPNNFSTGLAYYPLPKPIRLLDTRPIGDPVTQGKYNNTGPISGGQSRNYAVSGFIYNGYSIPASARAVETTVTVTNPIGPGFLTTYPGPSDPAGASRPSSASITYVPTQLISNGVTITLDANNTLNIFSLATTDVVVDINGYYAPLGTPDPNNGNSTTKGQVYYPLKQPTRIIDTRNDAGVAGTAYYTGGGPISGGTALNRTMTRLTFAGNTIPSEATALIANLSVINPAGPGFLVAYGGSPDAVGANRPAIANMTYNVGQTLSSQSLVGLDVAGRVNIFSLASANLVFDVAGFYAPAGLTDPNGFSPGLLYYPLQQPVRLVDTRPVSDPNVQGRINNVGAIVGKTAKTFQLANFTYAGYTLPATSKAIQTNVTIITPPKTTGAGFMTIYPGPTDPTGASRPSPANLTFGGDQVLSNAATVTLGRQFDANFYIYASGIDAALMRSIILKPEAER